MNVLATYWRKFKSNTSIKKKRAVIARRAQKAACKGIQHLKARMSQLEQLLREDDPRDTRELCEHKHTSECRSCELSGEPNPEAFTRAELVSALIYSYQSPAFVATLEEHKAGNGDDQ